MKYLPHTLGALLLVSVAGVVSGEAIGDAPILKAKVQDTLPDAQPVSIGRSANSGSKRAPDHYPLETAEGTIAVGELALHGRLRDTPQAQWLRESSGGGPAAYDVHYDEADLARLAHEEALIAYTARPPVQPVEAEPVPSRPPVTEQPVRQAEPVPQPAEQASIGNAKTVDVAAVLESQGL